MTTSTFEEDGIEYATIELVVPVELTDPDVWTYSIQVLPRLHNPIRKVWPYHTKRGPRKGRLSAANVGKAASLIAGNPIKQEMHVDHIDNNPFNNRLSNLREATASENTRNRRTFGTSKYRGVSWCATRGAWRVRYFIPGGKTENLGFYKTEEEAAAVIEERRKRDGNIGV